MSVSTVKTPRSKKMQALEEIWICQELLFGVLMHVNKVRHNEQKSTVRPSLISRCNFKRLLRLAKHCPFSISPEQKLYGYASANIARVTYGIFFAVMPKITRCG